MSSPDPDPDENGANDGVDAGSDVDAGDDDADADSGDDAPENGFGYDAEFLLSRAAVTVLVAVVVVVAATLLVPGPTAEPSTPVDDEEMSLPEFEASTGMTKLPAEGEVSVDSVDSDGGVVVIDNSHGNRLARVDYAPIVEALVDLNYTVRFSDETDLSEALRDADAFVVADPGFPYPREDVAAIRNFTDRGGHLLVLAEPTRRRVSTGLAGTSVVGVPSFVDNVVHEYNASVDARYLYNQRRNDGNFKNVLGRRAEGARIGADRTAFYTAAPIDARTGRTLIFAANGTHLSETDSPGTYALAVRDGNFVAVGDTSFLRFQHYNVAGNERFIAYLVRFLASGEGAVSEAPPETEPEPEQTPTPTPVATTATVPNGTPTATPTGDSESRSPPAFGG